MAICRLPDASSISTFKGYKINDCSETYFTYIMATIGDPSFYMLNANGQVGYRYKSGSTIFEGKPECREYGIRPVVTYSEIADEAEKTRGFTIEGEKIVSYGEYPQSGVPNGLSMELEKKYNEGTLKATGKKYTIDKTLQNYTNSVFVPLTLLEYEFENEKYVRFDTTHMLKNCAPRIRKSFEWIKVRPIRWLVHPIEDLAISEKILLTNIQFSNPFHPNDSNAENFLKHYFSQEIEPIKPQKTVNVTNKDTNYFKFDYDEVSEEDIIKGAVLSDIPVFLHGKSSDGKSARVKQLDPDCVVLYLRNATPDSLNGKSVYNQETNEMIDIKPTWLVKLEERCQSEPDKIHILFLDELTNALPSIQGMAFNIVLDREVNGKWKLPNNARIVAAGNDLEDSLAANELAEPLFNRFAHVYIETNSQNWLKWAAAKKESYERLDYVEGEKHLKIHPAIYAYVAYHGINALRAEYNGIKPNADPRKWEMASKLLYKTNNPNMLRSLIGEAYNMSFITFCKNPTMVDNYISNHGVLTKGSIPLEEATTFEKSAQAVILSQIYADNYEEGLELVKQLDESLIPVYDTFWAGTDETKKEYLYTKTK